MADFKRRTLCLNNGKQIKLFGNSIAIGRSLEIGEGYAPNIFSCLEQSFEEKPHGIITKTVPEVTKPNGDDAKKSSLSIANPYRLSAEELMEIADYSIRLWLDLKDNIRKFGTTNPKIFNRET